MRTLDNALRLAALGLFIMLSACETTDKKDEEPEPEPESKVTHIKEVFVSYSGDLEKFHFVNAETKRAETYMNIDDGDIIINFRNELETTDVSEKLNGCRIKNISPDTIDISSVNGELLKQYILRPSTDEPNEGYSLLYAGGNLQYWKERIPKISEDRFIK